MSKELREFLQAWLDWAESGATRGYRFLKNVGLCTNLQWWLDDNMNYKSQSVIEELSNLFEAQGLDSKYPFGKANYLAAIFPARQHTCPVRLSWVREQLGASK